MSGALRMQHEALRQDEQRHRHGARAMRPAGDTPPAPADAKDLASIEPHMNKVEALL